VASKPEVSGTQRLLSTRLARIVVVDWRLPDQSGLDVVKALKAIDPSTVIVVLTGYGSIATALENIRLGAVHNLTKPIDVDRVPAAFLTRPGVTRPGFVDRSTIARSRRVRAHAAHADRLQ
jgi:two-component system, response regulator RegA